MMKTKTRLVKLLLGAAVCLACVVSLLPILWMLLSSLRSQLEFFSIPPTLLPKTWTLENYVNLFERTRFTTWIVNSLLVTAGTIFLSTAAATLASYSLARFHYRGRKQFILFSMVSYMMPTVLLAIPMYVVFARIGLVDNLLGLVVSYVAMTLPYSIWLLRSFFKSLPFALEESAAVDGASRLRTLVQIVLPMSMPGIIATVVYTFTYVWNEYMFAVILLSSDAKMTFPVGLKSFITDLDIRWEYIMTGGMLVSVPAMALFLFTQKHLIRGFSAGAVKG